MPKSTDDQVTEDVQLEDTPVDDAPSVDFAGAGGDEPSLAPPSLASLLRQKNFDIDDDATDDDVLSHMEELESAAEERERLRQENEQYKAWYAQQQQAHKPEAKPEPEPQPAKPESKAPEVPEWDEAWEGWLTQDDRGNIVVRPELRGAVDPSLPQKYITYKKWERERLRTLLKQESSFDPSSLDGKFQEVEERAYKRALEEFEKKLQQTATQSYLQKYEQDNASWLNADQQLRNLLSDRVAEFIQRGFSPEEAVQYAQFDVERQTGKAPWKTADAEANEPPPTPKQRRVSFRAKAKNNGHNRIAQEPVQRKGAMSALPDKPESIRQVKNKYAALFNESAE